MNLEITTRCNMHCAHCAVGCTEHGEDMSEEVFGAAIELIYKLREAGLNHWWPGQKYLRNPSTFNLGPHNACFAHICGGEPTVHPKFWDFVSMAYVKLGWGVWVVTNGKKTEDALQLALMAEERLVVATLSLDKYHETISLEVVKAFHRDPMGLKVVSCIGDHVLAPSGRAIENGLDTQNICLFPDLYVAVDGTIYACGCKSKSFGTVFDHHIPRQFFKTPWYCGNNLTILGPPENLS
jgi:hypothetical protein